MRLRRIGRQMNASVSRSLGSCLLRYKDAARSCLSTASGHEVLQSRLRSAYGILLNRPEALNALNLQMIRVMTPMVRNAIPYDSTTSIILASLGGKAFCAGGDIKVLLGGEDRTRASREAQEDFFREEYYLDYALAEVTKQLPVVALMDGITMGGGVGLSINASFRIATERCVFAMPETGIGFFPDVGGSYFLANSPRLSSGLGMFLGLTGARLAGKEAVAAGVATHFVPSDRIEDLYQDVSRVESRDHALVEAVVSKHAEQVLEEDAGVASERMREFVEGTFGNGASLEAMREGCDYAAGSSDPAVAKAAGRAGKALRTMSPFSLAVTREQLLRGAGKSLSDLLQMELRVAMRMTDPAGRSDFYEGVKSVVVERRKPKWKEGEITQEQIDAVFAPFTKAEPEELDLSDVLKPDPDIFSDSDISSDSDDQQMPRS